MNTQDLITEFNQNREANLKALLVKYTPGCGEIKDFLKKAMNYLIREIEPFEIYENQGLDAAIVDASEFAFCALDKQTDIAFRKEIAAEDAARMKRNSSVKTYRRLG